MGCYMKQVNFVHDVADIFYSSFSEYFVSAVFYLTQYCDLACPNCYMHSSPKVQKAQIPTDDVKFYLGELKTLPNFLPGVAFAGGEIFTLPLSYIKENIENAFDQDIRVELKTNGTWAMNPEYKQSVFNMVREINMPKHLFNIDPDILEYFISKEMTQDDKKQFRRYKLLHRGSVSRGDYIVNLAKNKYHIDLRYSPLSMGISVDNNVIHNVADSNNAYRTVLRDVLTDGELRQKISLGCITVVDKGDNYVPQETKMVDGYGICVTRDKKVNPASKNYFNGQWIKKTLYSKKGKLIKPGQINLWFRPDRTVSLESELNYQPIGRVSYIKDNGDYKKMPEIIDDITHQLIQDYRKYQR